MSNLKQYKIMDVTLKKQSEFLLDNTVELCTCVGFILYN